jgi:hypothetical protein
VQNLYRGFSKTLITTEQVNKFYHASRVPINTSIEIHEAADRWFFEKFGIYARSSSLICTTDFSQANSYGIAYRISPEPPSPMIYSHSVKDFLEHESDLDVLTEESIRAWLESQRFNLVYSTSEIDPGFFGEVMVFCKSYRAILRS